MEQNRSIITLIKEIGIWIRFIKFITWWEKEIKILNWIIERRGIRVSKIEICIKIRYSQLKNTRRGKS
jgi:hypothetical protein